MQQTSKWRTYLPYLHLETLRVYNLLADDYKNTISTQTPSYARPALSPVERGLFLWDPGPMNVTIDRQKVQKTVLGGKFSSETCKFKGEGRRGMRGETKTHSPGLIYSYSHKMRLERALYRAPRV